MKIWRLAWKLTGNIDLLIAGASLIAVVILTMLGVFMRYAVNRPFSWMEEVQLILFVWMAFFGASVAFRLGGHIAIEIVVDMFPRKWRRAVEVADSLIVAALLGYVAHLEYLRGLSLIRSGRTTNILQIPQYYTYFGVSAACCLMLLNLLARETRTVAGWFGKADSGEAGP